MFIYAIGSKEEKNMMPCGTTHTSVIGRTSPGCSLELLADVCQDRMKDRLFAAKRMPILAIVNFISGGQDADFHTPWAGHPRSAVQDYRVLYKGTPF